MKKFLFSLFVVFLFSFNIYADKIKYVFLFIGDGMSMASEFALSNFLYGKDKLLVWNNFPVQTHMTTWSINSYEGEYSKNNIDREKGYFTEVAGPVPYPYYDSDAAECYFMNLWPTDSAAAATAMATGEKVHNSCVCYDDDNDKFISNIVDKINKKKEYNVALITTDKFYSATPAGFSSHNVSRNNYKEIAAEILSKTKPEIVIGKNEFDDIKSFAALNDYYVMNSSDINRPQVFDLIDKKIFINLKRYFDPKPVENFTLEPFEYTDSKKKFSNVVLYATKLLLQKRKPFFALVEVAGIDHANHDNNFNKMLGAMYEFNETVKGIYDLINSKSTDMTFDNTAVIVTADHCTGLLRFREYLGKGKLPATYTIKEKNAKILTNKKISFKTKGHANELVGCYFLGPKTDVFKKYINEKNMIDNTDIYNVLNDIIIKGN